MVWGGEDVVNKEGVDVVKPDFILFLFPAFLGLALLGLRVAESVELRGNPEDVSIRVGSVSGPVTVVVCVLVAGFSFLMCRGIVGLSGKGESGRTGGDGKGGGVGST